MQKQRQSETLSCSEMGLDQEILLVDRAVCGESTAFDQLFDIHKRFVHNVCYRMLGSADDAVDATQATFIQAYNGLDKFKRKSSFRTWLYRIAINTCTRMLRDRQRRCNLERNVEMSGSGESSDDRLWTAMLRLPPDMRSMLVLFYFQQLSIREISEILGCSEGAVKVRLHRARLMLRSKYEELDYEV